LAREIAHFHDKAPVAFPESPFGNDETVAAPVDENYRAIVARLGQTTQLADLWRWSQEEHARCKREFHDRKAQGYIRECHGDLHLENMVQLGNRLALFDCIEFSEPLRWIDVISDLAFALMDMRFRGAWQLANRLLNRYLEQTGDYAGVTVSNFYLVYRAMVRSLVVCIRSCDSEVSNAQRKELLGRFERYVNLADSYTRKRKNLLIVTHGLSGSGKTTFTQSLLEELDAIRVRSDVERKRQFGTSTGTSEA
jgi:hypothetical protein